MRAKVPPYILASDSDAEIEFESYIIWSYRQRRFGTSDTWGGATRQIMREIQKPRMNDGRKYSSGLSLLPTKPSIKQLMFPTDILKIHNIANWARTQQRESYKTKTLTVQKVGYSVWILSDLVGNWEINRPGWICTASATIVAYRTQHNKPTLVPTKKNQTLDSS